MEILETSIPDVIKENVETSKVILAESIIKNVYPLFDVVYTEQLNHVKRIKSQIKQKKSELKERKTAIEATMAEYNRKKKITKVLSRIETLMDAGLIYDSSMKHEMVILLRIIEKLPMDKLDQQLSRTMGMINKRIRQ